MEVVLIVAASVAGIGLLIGLVLWAEKKRRDDMQRVAAELGLEFYPKGSEVLQSQLSGFKLFGAGRSRKLTGLIQGESDEVTLSIFDYQYTTGSGKNSHTHRQTVASMQSTALSICEFSMRAENFLDKLGNMVGFSDIDFKSHPNFSNWFVLKGASETEVRKLFEPNILTYFESKRGISVEGQPGKIIIFRPGSRTKPKDIKNFLAEAYEVYGIFVDNLPPP